MEKQLKGNIRYSIIYSELILFSNFLAYNLNVTVVNNSECRFTKYSDLKRGLAVFYYKEKVKWRCS